MNEAETRAEYIDPKLAHRLKYKERGVEELGEEKLPILLNLKYHLASDAIYMLGDVEGIRSTFFEFQKSLYYP